jgi:inner membrane protein
MPTIITHAVIPIAVGYGLGKDVVSPRLVFAGIVASILPDLDVIAFRYGIPYSSDFGHRGFTHSLAFALALGIIAALIASLLRSKRLNAFLFISIAAASHGLLDMLTNGGLGVALLWPYSSERMFFPWRVINVSPLSLWQFLGLRGWYVIASELLWVWLPAAVLFILLSLGTSKNRTAGPKADS